MKDMVWRVPLVSIVVCLLLPVFLGGLKTFASEQRPNIVVILVDDLGYSDLGCYGGEIETPHLDRMAAEGIRFTQFYNTARCWPTRSALMTGYYAQTIGKDAFPGVKSRGSRGTRPRFAPLASLPLAMSGYRNYHVGKWHLDGLPTDNDFHRSYWLRDHNRLFTPEKHFLDDVALPVVKKEEGYYATDAIAQYAVDFLAEHANGHPNTPFFAYVCFNVPHFPLQAPQSTIEKYDGRYDLGPSPMRRLRFERLQKQLDFRSELSEVEPDVGPPYSFEGTQEELGGIETFRPAPWEDLTAEQQQFQADKMEIHAAMVDHIDQGVGRILDQIEAMGETDNTMVVFLSDNGASAEIMVRGDGHQTNAARGSRDTYLCLGPGFSNACNTPFRRHKTWVHEGGCATPMIVRWPAVIDDPGSLRHDVGHVIDFWTTFLELSGAP
ncbi:MAG: sulfatase-like hydrolase/transferase [Planctomycetota bacterium]